MGLQSEQGAGHAVSCARCKVQGAGCRKQGAVHGLGAQGGGGQQPAKVQEAGWGGGLALHSASRK